MKTLVIASEYTGKNIQRVIDAFESSRDVKIEFVTEGKENLLNFIPRAPADMVMTSVGEELDIAKGAGWLQPMSANTPNGS